MYFFVGDCMNDDFQGKMQCCPVNDNSIVLDRKQRRVFFWVLICVLSFLTLLGWFTKVTVFAVGALVLLVVFSVLGWLSLYR